ncbi:MAG: TIGR03905 family TSCPD domain-containing protein [Bacilli bacterium]|nr:TIGR03905 family TSCPD domain-containing protein [Bacilli bacterium]
MHKTYTPSGVCSKQIDFDIEDGKIYNLSFQGGCNGNLKGIAALVEGQNVNVIKEKLKEIKCGPRNTSCPAQLAKALEEFEK